MRKKPLPSWRVVYGVGDLLGVTFVRAKDDVEASQIVKANFRAMCSKPAVIYSVAPDVRDPS